MIKNLTEYNLTSSTLKAFEERKLFLERQMSADNVQLEINGIVAISDELRQQIQEYENIVNKNVIFDTVESLQELPTTLIGKRLQLNISQEEMALKIKMDVSQYIELENNDFYEIDRENFEKILDILRLDNPHQLLTKDYVALMPIIESNLRKLDNKASFIANAIKPIKEMLGTNTSLTNFNIEKLIHQFKEVFSINIQEEIEPSKMQNSLAVAFKHKINVNDNNLNLSTAYAAYVARVITKQMKNSIKCKADPIAIRQLLLEEYGGVSLEACVDFIWKHNVAVIPLNIHGSFHGACLDFSETKAIVLSQQNKTISRWKFDLLHELYHALVMEYSLYIERTDIMDQNEDEEKQASEFASYVIFGQEMESVLELILAQSGGHMSLVKDSVISIGEEFGLNIDDLANYVAFRISKGGLNFWGTAMNLQKDRRNPADILLSYLRNEINLAHINTFEFEVLQTIFNQEVILLG